MEGNFQKNPEIWEYFTEYLQISPILVAISASQRVNPLHKTPKNITVLYDIIMFLLF